MYLRAENRGNSQTVPLKTAVLCVDCESLSSSPFDHCPVCGSRSVFNVAPILGGSLLPSDEFSSAKDQNVVRFDLEIEISLKRLEAKDVTAVVEDIADLVRLKLGRSRASIHIDATPVANIRSEDEFDAKAA